jgi:hypothetical protein
MPSFRIGNSMLFNSSRRCGTMQTNDGDDGTNAPSSASTIQAAGIT